MRTKVYIGFRASYPQALLDFEKQYKGAKVLLMETNYRSTENIVNTANRFIKQNKNRKDKNLKSNKEQGNELKFTNLRSMNEQYNYIVEMIKSNNKEIAILYRNNDSAIPIIDIFAEQSIDFKTRGNESSFFTNRVVRDILTIIKFLLDPTDLNLFRIIYFRLNCGISKKQFIEVENIYQGKNVVDTLLSFGDIPKWQRDKLIDLNELSSRSKSKTSSEILASVINEIGYGEDKNDKISKLQSPFEQKVNILYAISKRTSNISEFFDRLKKLEEIIKEGVHGTNKKSNIVLSTIHASKGLEYEKVVIIDNVDGIFPSVDEIDSISDYEEEVRLFYVAMTRAKSELEIITYDRDYQKSVTKSKFARRLHNYGDKMQSNSKHSSNNRNANYLDRNDFINSIM